jgi:predicted dehydrogenase
VAMLGTGGIAAKHVRSFLNRKDVQIVAGCDVSEEVVKAFWDRVLPADAKRPPCFSDPAKMYQTKPDAVVICTPHTVHFEQGMQAIDHGCHVLMEKPMVTSAEHAYKLRDKVAQAGKVLLVAYNTPCSPEFQFIREQIRTNALGRLELISGFLFQGWMEVTRGKWRQDPALSGGGQAYDSGAHLLNSLCWSVESPVAEVHAFIQCFDCRVDINSSINIRFENGAFASIAIGGNCPASGAYLTYAFSNGRINVDGWNATWLEVFKGRDRVKYPLVTGEPQQPADNFVDAIHGKVEARTTPDNGIIHSELMDAIYESARTGKPAKPRRHAAVAV